MTVHTVLLGVKRKATKIACVAGFLFGSVLAGHAQDGLLRIGVTASPVMSWLRTNDDLIVPSGGSLGLRLGIIGEVAFRDPFYISWGVNFSFHEGGEIHYEIGGNYLPNSSLSDEMLQTGDKPLPDGTTIRYSLQYLDFPVGFRYRSGPHGNLRYFFEAPRLTFSLLTRARGVIETDDAVYEGENIFKDMSRVNMLLGLGGGIEYEVSQTNSLILGLFYEHGLLDITQDNGYRAIRNPELIPMYLTHQDRSHTTLRALTLRIGFLF